MRRAQTVLIANPGADLYGSDRMVLETVTVLVEAGWRVMVAVPGAGPLVQEIKDRGAEVAFCPTPVVRKSALRPWGIISLLADVLRSISPGIRLIRSVRPDVVYVNTVTSPLWILLARLLRKPCVCHVHEGEASASRVVLLGLNAPLLLTQALIINSEFSRSVLLGALPRLRDRMVVVYNSVPAASEIAEPRRSLGGPCRLVYVGRLSPRKGPDVAIAAVALLKSRGVDATLGLVGAVFPGYEWFERQLQEQVAAAGLGDSVLFHGFQPDVWPFTSRADILLVPSTVDEPFGNTAVEAVLARRPVVVSQVGGLPEAVAGFSSVTLVAPGIAEQVADAVAHVIKNWAVYRGLAIQDGGLAAIRYSSAHYAQGIGEVLEGLL